MLAIHWLRGPLRLSLLRRRSRDVCSSGGIDLTGIGYDRGSSSAPVVMIDLSDFACPYCAEFSKETYPAIEKEYVKTGKLFFKYVPFLVGSFPHSDEATRAGGDR